MNESSRSYARSAIFQKDDARAFAIIPNADDPDDAYEHIAHYREAKARTS